MKHEQVKPRGRPKLPEAEKAMVKAVSLPEAYWEKLMEIGDGNRSQGVRTVLEAYAPDDEDEVDAESTSQ